MGQQSETFSSIIYLKQERETFSSIIYLRDSKMFFFVHLEKIDILGNTAILTHYL